MLPFKLKKLPQALSPVVESDLPETRISFSSILGKPTISAYMFMYQWATSKTRDNVLFDTCSPINIEKYVPKFSYGGLDIVYDDKLRNEIFIGRDLMSIRRTSASQLHAYLINLA